MAKTNEIIQILSDEGEVVMESGLLYWMRYKSTFPGLENSWQPVQVGAYSDGIVIYTLGGELSAHTFDVEKVDICECRTPDQDAEYYKHKIRFGKYNAQVEP